MAPYHPDLLAVPVPRYTSYPTAAEFTPTVAASAQRAALVAAGRAHAAGGMVDATAEGEDETGGAGGLSLYVHIPYCREICWYCGCNTGAANRQGRLTAYLDALARDIALTAAALREGAGGAAPPITRIAFGGGSPNAIAPVAFVRLIDRLLIAFGASSPRLSLELDPRTIDPGWYDAIRMVGVTDASLGVQTFDPAIQAAIGRVQPRALIAEATDRLRDAGVTSVNFDLMYGLPGQTQALLDETLDQALALAPDRIALFGYAHVPDRLPRQRRIDATRLPGAATRFAMAADGARQLAAAGMVPVGFDHFAKPGDPLARAVAAGRLRRNFQGYTDDDAAVLVGLGASAISLFPDRIIQNEKNAGRYRALAGGGALTGALGIGRDRLERARARAIEALLCGREADLGEAVRHDPALPDRLAPFAARGLGAWRGRRFRAADDARPYWRGMAAAIDPWRQRSTRRFSAAV